MIDLANGFQLGLELLVIVQPLGDLWFEFGADGELFGATTGVADGKDIGRMAVAESTLLATLFVANGAMEQRATEDEIERRKGGEKFGAFGGDVSLFHYY